MQRKPFSRADKNGPAPRGEIRAPTLAELVQPLLSGALLGPGEIGEGAARGPGRTASLKSGGVLRIEARGAGGAGRSWHRASVTESKKGEKGQ
jgi:hypothetical protein